MVLNNRLGRPKRTIKYTSPADYLNKYIFPIKDILISLKEVEHKKENEFLSASNRKKLQEQKLERAYEGLEDFRNRKK